MKKNTIFLILITLLFVLIASQAFAAEAGIAQFIGLPSVKNIPEFIGFALRVILGIMGSVALLMFVWGGITWLTSGGSPDKIKKAKDTLVWATIGLIIIFASYALVDFIIKAVAK